MLHTIVSVQDNHGKEIEHSKNIISLVMTNVIYDEKFEDFYRVLPKIRNFIPFVSRLPEFRHLMFGRQKLRPGKLRCQELRASSQTSSARN